MRPFSPFLLVPLAVALSVAQAPARAQIDVPLIKTSPKLKMSVGPGGVKDADIVTEKAESEGAKPGAPGAASAAKAEGRADAKEPKDAKGSKPVRTAKTPPPPIDPMERLRERLAEKLGAQAPEGEKNKYVMRVSTHGESGESTISAGRASTAAVAAAHRADPARGGAIDSRAAPAGADPHAHAGPAHWDYTGAAGPDAWGQLKPEFSTCSTGTRQSPIDIRGGIAVELAPIQFDYRPSGFGVIDNGHTVQVNVAPGNSISVMGRRYDLVQFHFHRPSEERIDGRQFDMVAHMVHKDVDGRLAVVAILLDRGAAQPIVQAVWNNLPLEKGEELRAPGTIDLTKLLPEDRRYYTYMGSLTTPPCSEGVLWMVMKQPMNISPEQVGIFSKLYPMNARPIQQAAGRLIKESN
jgi:carbonic anhydrase